MEPHSRDSVAALHRIAAAVSSRQRLEEVLNTVVSTVAANTHWKLCWISAADFDHDRVEVIAREDNIGYLTEARRRYHPLNESPVAEAVLGYDPFVVRDVATSKYPAYAAGARATGYNTAVLIRLGQPDRLGRPLLLSVQTRRDTDVLEGELEFLGAVAELTSIAVANARQLSDVVNHSHLTTKISLFIESIASRGDEIDDPETELGRLAELIDGPIVVADAFDNTLLHSRMDEPLPSVRVDEAAVSGSVRFRGPEGPGHSGLRIQRYTFDGKDFVLTYPDKQQREPEGRSIDALVRVAVMLVMAATTHRETIDLRHRLLSSMVTEDERELALLRVQLASTDVPYHEPFLLLQFWNDEERQPAPQISELEHAVREGIVTFALERRSLHETFDGSVWILLPSATNISKFVEWMTSRLRKINSQARILVSSPGLLPQDMMRMWQECYSARQFARVFPGQGFISFSEMGVLGILVRAAGGNDALVFVENQIGPLIDYDEKHSAELVETLRVYLRNSSRLQPTARDLHIHVSTLRYRLERISNILQTDLNDPDKTLSLNLACTLNQLRA